VYAEPLAFDAGAPAQMRPARERGFEGVACVDDAARAAVLYCDLFRLRPDDSVRSTAIGLLQFITYMQEEDGRFANFILDWTGIKNLRGATSYLGGPQWQARAMHALARGAATFGTAEWDLPFRRGLRWLDTSMPYLDVRAVCVLATLEHWRATGDSGSAERALAWSAEIARERQNGHSLLNASRVESIHLWGHLQETALAEAGSALDQPGLVDVARASAERLLLPAVAWCHTAMDVLPFDVSCVVSGLAAVGRATGDGRFADAASSARAWFDGHNAAGQPVYDRESGAVYDGIDNGCLSRNSGAESNIEGGLAMLDA
jgi:hypothetical protein